MSVSSLAALPVSAPVAPQPAARAGGTADAQHATPFAQILSRGKATEKDAGDDAKPVSEKTGTDSQDSGDTAADSTAAPATAPIAATPDDLNAAASEGVSAVLALIGSMQVVTPPPMPTTAQPSGTDVVADVAPTGTALPARLFAMGRPAETPVLPSPPAQATPVQTPIPQPTPEQATTGQPVSAATPVDIAHLPPADLQLLHSLTADPKSAQAANVTALPDSAASGPDISPMAKTLQQAFGQAPQPATTPIAQGVPTAPKAAVLPPALPQSADAAAVTDTPATKRGASSRDDALPMLDIATGNVATGDGAAPVFTLPVGDKPAATTDIAAATPGIVPTHGEQSVTRHLDMLRDTQWLDRLAQDISQAATQTGHLKFQLNPEHLGSLAVEITNSAAGASIRMTTDNDNARAIIADAQPRLLAEVRAQGLRIAESHVDMGNQANSGNSTGHRSSSEDHKPFVRTQIPTSETPGDSAPRDDELYA